MCEHSLEMILSLMIKLVLTESDRRDCLHYKDSNSVIVTLLQVVGAMYIEKFNSCLCQEGDLNAIQLRILHLALSSSTSSPEGSKTVAATSPIDVASSS